MFHSSNKKLDTVEPRFNEVAGDRPNLFVKWRVRYIEVLFHTFYCNFGRDIEIISFVISRTSLNRGSLNRGSTVSHNSCQLWLIPIYWALERKETDDKSPWIKDNRVTATYIYSMWVKIRWSSREQQIKNLSKYRGLEISRVK